MTRALADFVGRWAIERTITHVGAARADFHGHATFEPDGDGLAYHEIGTLVIQRHPPMQSERRYRWDADLNVYFDEGRFFHTVPPLGGKTQHWCDPDDYAVDYDFSAWPNWTADWRVQGPRKNYRMLTGYRKAT